MSWPISGRSTRVARHRSRSPDLVTTMAQKLTRYRSMATMSRRSGSSAPLRRRPCAGTTMHRPLLGRTPLLWCGVDVQKASDYFVAQDPADCAWRPQLEVLRMTRTTSSRSAAFATDLAGFEAALSDTDVLTITYDVETTATTTTVPCSTSAPTTGNRLTQAGLTEKPRAIARGSPFPSRASPDRLRQRRSLTRSDPRSIRPYPRPFVRDTLEVPPEVPVTPREASSCARHPTTVEATFWS